MVLGMTARRSALEEHFAVWQAAEAPVRHVQFGGLSDEPFADEAWMRAAMDRAGTLYPDASFSAHAYKVNLAEKTPRVRAVWLAIAREHLQLAARLGLDFLNFHLGWGSGGTRIKHTAYREALVPVIEELVDLGEELGVGVHIENLYPRPIHAEQRMLGDRPSDFSRILSAVSSPALRLCYDYGHGNIDEYGICILRENAARLGSVHVHDNDQMNDLHAALFDGTIDWPAELAFLRRVGFRGPFILEQSPQRQLISVQRLRARGLLP